MQRLAQADNAHERLAAFYNWRFEVLKLALQAELATAGAFVVAFLLALARGDLAGPSSEWASALAGLALAMLVAAAYFTNSRLDATSRRYLEACETVDAAKGYGAAPVEEAYNAGELEG